MNKFKGLIECARRNFHEALIDPARNHLLSDYVLSEIKANYEKCTLTSLTEHQLDVLVCASKTCSERTTLSLIRIFEREQLVNSLKDRNSLLSERLTQIHREFDEKVDFHRAETIRVRALLKHKTKWAGAYKLFFKLKN